jgi:hypothetical protein
MGTNHLAQHEKHTALGLACCQNSGFAVALGRFGIAVVRQVDREPDCYGEAEGYASRGKDATPYGSDVQTIVAEVDSEEGDCSVSATGEWGHPSKVFRATVAPCLQVSCGSGP